MGDLDYRTLVLVEDRPAAEVLLDVMDPERIYHPHRKVLNGTGRIARGVSKVQPTTRRKMNVGLAVDFEM